MIEKSSIELLVKTYVSDKDLFLVALKVSASNKISILVDTLNDITIDQCVGLHRYIEDQLDREVEDYELQVSSPGLDAPFSVIEQYYKNQGKKVEVTDMEGEKETGILKNITKGGFDLLKEIKIKGKGTETKEIPYNFEQVKKTRVVIEFK